MTRIVAGRYGGRRLSAPEGRHTRPTSDRVREALFSTLDSQMDLSGARVIDLFAGSGAVGLEALSRGAAHALLVEHDPKAVKVIRANIAALDAQGQARVVAGKVGGVLAGGNPEQGYDLVFADPPYQVTESEIEEMLAALAGGAWLTDGALIVIERSSRSPEPSWVQGVTGERGRRYGESTLWYGRAEVL
ncbi:DNA methylase [Rhizocola hellebori]|uniref:DNA methylase n=1 Tax=Rhizocola hellebori TaxID=1392758 RepID=A0A8J3Q6U4_9ACTN|nr:16S rRNA (guanine(966)-N(2))-methyltransferase RsmD [Rhizocola hellebori]GIH04474.1 DNA methylase [Rhizocola hellebori]